MKKTSSCLRVADRNCFKSDLKCVKFYVYFFWPMIQEALVLKNMYITIFMAVLFVLGVFPAWKSLAWDRCVSHSLTSALGLHTFPWLLMKTASLPPFIFSLESPIFVLHNTKYCVTCCYVTSLHVSVSPIRMQIPWNQEFCLFCSPECLKQIPAVTINIWWMNTQI